MDVIIKNLPDYYVVYLRNYGYNEGIMKIWEKLAQWMKEKDLLTQETVSIGVNHDDPNVIPVDKCRYDACFSVPAGTRTDGNVQTADIAGGTYAVYTLHSGPKTIQNDIGNAYRQIFSEWIGQSGYSVDNKPCLEVYHPDCTPEVYKFDICIPVIAE